MPETVRLLAADLGAETGRVVAGSFDGERIAVEEVHRFANPPVEVAGTLFWDVLRLHAGVVDGIRAAGRVASVGIDTWGVDFGLLDRAGRLVANPVHYRDRRTDGMPEEAFRRVPRQEIYSRTGIQFMPINTLYQLFAMARSGDPQLEAADRLLTMPALLAYWLSGVQADEFTDATTTQCYDARAGGWATDLLDRLGIPSRIFGEVVPPGTVLGSLQSGFSLGPVKVIAPGTHDTASAVAAVPFEPGRRAAYISSGTWSLVGLEVPRPIINAAALDSNLTNEGGVAGTFRLLKNVMGLWLLQECRRAWAGTPADLPYGDLLRLAEEAPAFGALIDPDDERLLAPGDMPARLATLAAEHGAALPPDPGQVARCIFESLALKYRATIEQLEHVTGSNIETIHVIGGGAQNRLLCQMTADACARPVMAGPIEATAIGNLIVQAITLGLVASLAEARQMVRASTSVEVFEPRSGPGWDEAWQRIRGGRPAGVERRLA
jgi:rhamnulokinase